MRRKRRKRKRRRGWGWFRPGARSMSSSLSVVLFDHTPCRLPMQSTSFLLPFVSAAT